MCFLVAVFLIMSCCVFGTCVYILLFFLSIFHSFCCCSFFAPFSSVLCGFCFFLSLFFACRRTILLCFVCQYKMRLLCFFFLLLLLYSQTSQKVLRIVWMAIYNDSQWIRIRYSPAAAATTVDSRLVWVVITNHTPDGWYNSLFNLIIWPNNFRNRNFKHTNLQLS